jgi:hypothetical protein
MLPPQLGKENRIYSKENKSRHNLVFNHAKAILNGISDVLPEETFKNESHS